jgi:polar amino acid transport system permease protein
VIETFLNAKIAVAAWPILLTGLLSTMLLALMVVPLGIVGGLGLALLSTVRHAAVRIPVMAWVDLFRAFPPLVLLVLLYAGLPFAGVDLGSYGAVAVAFFLNTGAYYGEVLRAGIESVPPGQTASSRCRSCCFKRGKRKA